MPSQRVSFPVDTNLRLAGIVDRPEIGATENFDFVAVFAHCFTCTKDLKAIVKICRELAKRNIAVLRFDFRGLGQSDGDFSQSNFLTNLEDLSAAVSWASTHLATVDFLVGHSLGGAAVMATAMEFSSVKGIATLAAPSCTTHLAEFLVSESPEIESVGQGEVTIGGINHLIRRQMIDVKRNFDLKSKIDQLKKPHLIMHSPADETLDFQHAQNLFQWSGGPKTFVTLNDADHLLLKHRHHVNDVASQIAVWASQWCR